jgi:glycosyltransferase involved in cell wall biosynthesis
MKIVFCWSVISGYMAACWRELAARSGIELHVIAHPSGGSTAFQSDLLAGISHRLLSPEEQHDTHAVERIVVEQAPDIVVMTGWWLKPYRQLVHAARLARTKFVMGVDSPWRTEAQFLTRFRYGSTLRRVDHFVVTGERSWQYVARLGISPKRISRGMYGVDCAGLSTARNLRATKPWPRQFLMIGRYERQKAIDVLVEGYQRYRSQVPNPWPLVCCGRGADGKFLQGVDGVVDRGFVQPADLVEVLAASGALVIPSRFDPWPLALVEGAASGLPIICSDACGSAVEMVRPLFNGLVIPTDDPQALAWAMRQVHDREADLPLWGERSQQFAAAYSAGVWADRWSDVFSRLAGSAT